MEPTTDAQPFQSVFTLVDDDLLHRVKAPSGLHFEKHKLVPSWRDALARHGHGLQRQQRRNAIIGRGGRGGRGSAAGAAAAAVAAATTDLSDRVELERAAPLLFPGSVVREGHVEDVRDASRADHVVVVEQVAALAVRVDRHVLFHAREWAAARDGAQEIAKLDGIERIAELEEVREER